MNKNFDDSIKEIQDEYNKVVEDNKNLRAELRRLHSEFAKEEEIKLRDEQIAKLNEKMNCYGMRKNDYDKLMNSWTEHYAECHAPTSTKLTKVDKASYSIVIDEFAICTCYNIRCSCGKFEKSVYY